MHIRNQIEKLILNHQTTAAILAIEQETKALENFINVQNEEGLSLLELAAREG